jgi:7-cyano-7-deazaguanine synthase
LGASKELASAEDTAKRFGVPLKVIDISGVWASFSDVAEGRPGTGTSSAIALNAGVVFALNYVAWAGQKTLFVGLNKDDLIGRPWLINFFNKYIEASSIIRPSLTGVPPRGDEYSGLSFEFPLAQHTKGEVIELGVKLGVDLASAQSCQYSDEGNCGTCYICQSRKAAFSTSKVPDPTKYVTP